MYYIPQWYNFRVLVSNNLLLLRIYGHGNCRKIVEGL